ncbi:hypothetical protein [Stutzerimonas kirkiae]|uniref:hypothetical protein n=1 Tax=Stutzerimonas kirkiae TaxID=2211392 RepID=UPI0010383EF9|nr:hypothetical protein [Stutzerimonas kirkiae]TBV12771.1 hypothetical protein DNK01_13885 [Stutzerimonas kirkiae]
MTSKTSPTSPRDYAAAILAEPSRERRAQLLDACPEHWRALVRCHVENGFARVKAFRQHRAERAALAQQKPPAAPRREHANPAVPKHWSVPEVGNRHLADLRAQLGQEAP